MKPILVVEDQKMLRTILCDILNEHNYSTVEASDGIEGLDKIESESPSLVITDLVMPNYNGVDFLEMLTTLHPTTKILVATSLTSSDELRQQAENLVAKENFLKKPVEEEEVITKVTGILKG